MGKIFGGNKLISDDKDKNSKKTSLEIIKEQFKHIH